MRTVKLIKFVDALGKVVLVNPETICLVRQNVAGASGANAEICTMGGVQYVKETVEEIRAVLAANRTYVPPASPPAPSGVAWG